MNEIEKLESNITTLQTALEKAQKELEDVKTREWPRYGDSYWRAGVTDIYTDTWVGDSINKDYLGIGNVFRTEEDAKHYYNYLRSQSQQAYYKLKKFADDYNKANPLYIHRWALYMDMTNRWVLYEDMPTQTKNIYATVCLGYYGNVMFNSEEGCLAAIKELGEDTIRLALGYTSQS